MLQPTMKNQLQQIAFDMFRDFKKSVIEKHPKLKICISNETQIINDLISTIKIAKKKLKEKNKEKLEMGKFQIGYLSGFIRSNLNSKWIYEYIVKQSNEYKEFLVIKALLIHFKDNFLDQIRVVAIYNDLLHLDNNILDADSHISKKEIEKNELNELNQVASESQLLQTLDNYINKYISDFLNNESDETYVLPVEKYFNEKELMEIANLSF
jgi:hypothetical protein